ncbi:VanW family protein [Paenibacillus marinisediminis]
MDFMLKYRPIKRSSIRLAAGKTYYRLNRYARWWKMREQFALVRSQDKLACFIAEHSTPLYRELHEVDRSVQEAKVHNLRIAVERLNGIVLEPGEVFSYWRLIGKPTKRKGYQPGMILYCGQMKLGIGGGLCQLSNLIYWITLHSPLEVVERYRHSYDVFPDANRTQPFGSGATCAYNYLDLMIRNSTKERYQLVLKVGETHLQGEWRSTAAPRYHYKIEERNHRMTLEPWGGHMRHNELYRQVYSLDGTWLRDESIADNHALMMYAPLLSDGKGESQSKELAK